MATPEIAMARAPPPPLPVTVLRGHSSGVQSVCFLNQDVLLSGSQDGVVKVWNLERRRVCAEFQATNHGMGVQRLDRLGRGKIVSQGRDGLIKVWDAETFGGGGGGAAAAADGMGRRSTAPCDGGSGALTPEPLLDLATGAFHFCQFALTRWREEASRSDCCDGGRRRWERGRKGRGEEPRAGEKEEEGRGESDGVRRGGLFDPAGRENRVGGGLRERFREREVTGDEGKSRAPLSGAEPGGGGGERAAVAAAAAPVPVEDCFSQGSFAENAILAPSNEQHSVCLWDLRDRAPAYTIVPRDAEKKGMVMCVRLLGESPACASPFAVCGHDSGNLCVYDLRAASAEPLMESRLHKEPLLCVDVGSSCTQGVSGSADDSINVFKMNTKKGLCEVIKMFRLEHAGTSCVEIRRDQKLFVSGGWDRRLRVFGWKTPRPLAVLRSHEGSVYSVAHSPRIGSFASGSADSRVALWDVFSDSK